MWGRGVKLQPSFKEVSGAQSGEQRHLYIAMGSPAICHEDARGAEDESQERDPCPTTVRQKCYLYRMEMARDPSYWLIE